MAMSIIAALAVLPSLALAADAPSGATVAVSVDPRCATPEQADRLLAGLAARLPEVVVEPVPAGAVVPDDAVVWTVDALGECALALATVDGPVSLPLSRSASDDELHAALVRVAWWLELRARHAARARLMAPDPRQPPEPPTEPARAPPPPPEPPTLVIGAGVGVTYYPTPAEPAAVLRLHAGLPLGPHLVVALEGRLVTEVLADVERDVDVYDRSLGLFARYDVTLDDAALGVSLGLRWALPEIDADTAPVHVQRPASNLALTTGVGLAWSALEALRLRADLVATFAVMSRRLVSDDGVDAGDLGVLGVELLVGFELGL